MQLRHPDPGRQTFHTPASQAAEPQGTAVLDRLPEALAAPCQTSEGGYLTLRTGETFGRHQDASPDEPVLG